MGRPGILLTTTFPTSPLKPLNGIQRNLKGNKISTSPTKFVVFGPIGKTTRWPPWSLIDWDILNFSSVTAIWNSTKLGRKQDLNVLYQGCVFPADWKNKMATPASDWLRHFRLLLWNRWMEINKIHRKQDLNVFYHVCVFRVYWRNKIAAPACDWLRHFRFLLWNHWMEFNKIWQDARSQRPLISLCFSGRSKEKDGRPASDLPRHFDFSSVTAEQDSRKLDRKQDLSVLYQFVLFGPIKKAALASDWLKHFQLLLCDRWREFNETWQEAKFQRPLPSPCYSIDEARYQCPIQSLGFFWPMRKQDGCPGLWLTETFSTSPLNGIQQNLTGNKICQRHLPSLCFLGRSEKHFTHVYDMWPLGLLFVY